MEWNYWASFCSYSRIIAACMCTKYSYRKLHTLICHAITCITCSVASGCLMDFRSSSDSFGSPVLTTSVELVQVETKHSSLKTDVMMTANRCSTLTFWLLIIVIFAIVKPGVRRPQASARLVSWNCFCADTSVCVRVFVWPPPRLLITSGVMWHDMDSIRLVKQILLATVVVIVNGRGLGIVTHRRC